MFQRPLPILIFGILFTGLAAAFLSTGIQNLYSNWQFTGDVIRVSGTVDKLDRFSHGHTITYLVNYHYIHGNSLAHVMQANVGQHTWRQLHVGGEVSVKYLPGAPTMSSIDLAVEDEDQWRNAWSLTIMEFLMTSLGLYIALFMKPKPQPTIPIREALSRIQSGLKNR